MVHAATDKELSELRWFEGSGRSVEQALGDGQDVLCNWQIVERLPREGRVRLYLIETVHGGVAWVDGESFGRVGAPDAAEFADFLSRHDFRGWD